MYESYWHLEQRPFESTSDSQFYYPSEGHQGALLKLRYTIENHKGAALLVGEHGIGKTMIVEMLKRQLPEWCAPVAHLVFPQMSPADLLAYVTAELHPEGCSQASVQQNVKSLQTFLANNTAEGKHAVVVVDEAHLIEDPACWDTLRLLLNFQSTGQPDLTLLLCGQLSLLTTLDRIASWEERLDVKCLLKAFTLDETACYLQHRLQVAGGKPEIFSHDAIEALYRIAGGLPRRINRVADLSLVIGYAEETPSVSVSEIEAVSGELISVSAS